MKITNYYNLPEPLVSAVSAGIRIPKDKSISTTQLIDSPQIRVLRKYNWHKIEEDVSDMIWMLLGTSVHAVLEQADTSNHIADEKLPPVIRKGWNITGIPDLLDNEGVLSDWKVTSVFSFLLGVKESWTAQLNVYRWLYYYCGFNIKKLQIVAILRDWQKSKLLTDSKYPQCPVHMQNVPMWDIGVTEKYVTDRLELHQTVEQAYLIDGSMLDCTDEERWTKPSTWAVKKKGNKKATRVLNTEDEALKWIEAKELPERTLLDIEHRPGSNIRCESYCSVSTFCKQIKGE